ERRLHRPAHQAVGVDLDVVLVEARDLDLEGERDGHDVVLAVVVVAELEDALRPPQLVAAELDGAGQEVLGLAVGAFLGRDADVLDQDAVVRVVVVPYAPVRGTPATLGRELGGVARGIVADHVETDPIARAVVERGRPPHLDRSPVFHSQPAEAVLVLLGLLPSLPFAATEDGITVAHARRRRVDRQRVRLGIVASQVGREAGDADSGGERLEQRLGVRHERLESVGQLVPRMLDELLDRIQTLVQHAIDTARPFLDRGGQGALDTPRHTRGLTQAHPVELLHVRLLHELDEAQRETMTEQRQQEDRLAPRDDRGTPDARETDGALRIVEEAVDATVVELGRMVEEEIAEEPAEFAQGLVDAGDRPELQGDEGKAQDVTQDRHAHRPVLREAIHLPGGTDETGVAHDHAEMVDPLPLAPSFIGGLAVFDKVPCPVLLLRLPIEDEADADGVPESPDRGAEDEERLPGPGGGRDEGDGVHVGLQDDDGHVGDPVQIHVADDVVDRRNLGQH
ncbi:hypothetical protein Tdes44962_MAKER01952, partial [Teratosphaeria destructans]